MIFYLEHINKTCRDFFYNSRAPDKNNTVNDWKFKNMLEHGLYIDLTLNTNKKWKSLIHLSNKHQEGSRRLCKKVYITVNIFNGGTCFQQLCSIRIQNTMILKHICLHTCLVNWWTVQHVCSDIPFIFISWTLVYLSY